MSALHGEGRVFGGRFRATRLVKGGEGVATLEGLDISTGDPVIVKTAAASDVSPSVRRRLEHEAFALRVVRSRWLTPLLDVGRDGEHVYLVMPLVAGITLERRLAAGRLTVVDAIVVGRCLFSALSAAHDHGIVHRDVKPANLIVDEHPPIARAVLVDFGLARSQHLAAPLRNLPAGTVRYMSPEQSGILDRGVDARADLYSAGVVLFECLAGRPPFAAPTVGELLRLHLTAPAPSLKGLGIALPAALDDVVQRLLQKDPRDRYQSAEAAWADLTEIAEALGRGVHDPAIAIGARDRHAGLTEPAFIGRATEIATLEELIAATADGRGGLVLLEAESGGGKTRLLDEVARRSAHKGAWVLRGQGVDQAAQRPFQVLEGVVQEIALAARAEAPLVAAIRARLGDHADAVCATFPQLGDLFGARAEVSVGPEEFAEARGVPALATLLDALASSERPAVVLLDDCQWADELSVTLLGHWQARASSKRGERPHVLVVVAFRSEEVAPEHALRALGAAAHLRLPVFSDADVRDMVESMAGMVAEEAVDLVARLSEGSPFMAAAVLRGLVEGGALVHEAPGWRIDPERMAAAQASRRAALFLARRLELLPPAALALLSIGAVLGKEFDVDLAVRLAERPPHTALAAIAEARQRHLVWADADGARCVFVHDKVRAALLDRLSPEARRHLHRRSAQHIEALDRGRAFELAYHFDAADEPGCALPYALVAAESARARHALEVAERYYRIAARGASSDARTRRRVAEGLADVLMLRGRYDEAAAKLGEARQLAADPHGRAALEGKLGELAFKRGDMRAASVALERALSLLDRPVPAGRVGYALGLAWEVLVQTLHTLCPRLFLARRPTPAAEDLLAARIYSRLAYAYWFRRGRIPCGWAHLREMNLMERYPPTPELAQAYSEHAPVMTMVPRIGRGIAYAERSLAIRQSQGDVWGQGQSLHFYGVVLYAGSRFRDCIAKCREAVRLLERTGDRWEVNTASWHIAVSHYRLGELGQAVAWSQRTHEAGRALGDRQASGISLGIWAKASGGQVPRALIEAALAEPSEDIHTTAEVLQAEALRLLADDRPAEAVAVLERAQRMVDAAGLRQEYVAPILPWLATALRRHAEAAPAWAPRERRALLRRAAAAARRARRLAASYRNNLPHALRECGLVAAMAGRPRRAWRFLAQSLTEAERQGARHECLETRLARARVGRVAGWPDAAREEAEASDALASLRMEVEAARPTGADRDTPFLADRFATLLEVGRAIASARTRTAVFEALREGATTLLRAERALILEIRGGRLAPAPGSSSAAWSRTVAEGALGTGRPIVVVEGLNDDAGASVALAGVRSVLCAPYFVRGAPAGCLYATHRLVGGLFDEADARVAEFMASLAGAALEQAAAFAEVEALLADKKRAEKRFRSLIENATDLITVLGPDGTIRYESPALERIRGYRPEELVGQSVFDSIHPDDRDAVTRELAAGVAHPGTMRSVELRVRHRDGSWRRLEAVGKVSRDAAGHLVAIVNSRDVTERRALEEQLRQSQRMEAVGRLAGGIAHDFNNLLTVILGCSHALRGARAEDDPVRHEADLIAETAEHAASLTRQLLAFGRRQVLQPKVLDLNEVVLGLEALLHRLIGEQIELVIALDPWLARVKADPAQIEQVIINLAVNARDAMPNGGRLTIETADAPSPASAPNGVPAAVPHVRLSVSDTGVGMDAATRHSVFEPFFTTKAVGHGTGLGLATVYGIIEQSGGRIAVDSAPGKGARFDVHLPRVDAPLDHGAGVAREAPRAALARGRETVLLAEDQGVLRDLFREVLLDSGYRVLAAGNGEEALAVLERHDGPIDLVVTDVVMPIMGGRELVARLRDSLPTLKVLYMTGYAPDAVMPARGDEVPIALLRKPFDPPVLTQAVRKLLDG